MLPCRNTAYHYVNVLPSSFLYSCRKNKIKGKHCQEDLHLWTNKLQSIGQNSEAMASNSTDMPSNSVDSIEDFETFLYSPYGVSTVAVVAIILTSLIWLSGCCIYCCYRRRHRDHQEGMLEANREIYFFGMTGDTSNQQHGNGTLSSGYNTGPPPSYSFNSLLNTNNTTYNSSLDSIINTEA